MVSVYRNRCIVGVLHNCVVFILNFSILIRSVLIFVRLTRGG